MGEYHGPVHHPSFVVLIIGITALGGAGSIVLGLAYCMDLRQYSALLMAGGAGFCIATLRYLPAGKPRFRMALVFLTMAMGCELSAAGLSHLQLAAQKAQYGQALPENPNIRAMATVEEKEVYTYEMIRNGAAVFSGVGALLWIYIASKSVRCMS
ncbi:MAG TPA: hypothetical protein VFE47_25415 [Tepidisphaeraceae bacterium]|nr:hypothetical protein [Tepidisphaeraceae bacterium]